MHNTETGSLLNYYARNSETTGKGDCGRTLDDSESQYLGTMMELGAAGMDCSGQHATGKRYRTLTGQSLVELILDHGFGMNSTSTTACAHTQVLFKILSVPWDLAPRFVLHCFFIHSFTDANKHIPRRNETQSHVNSVLIENAKKIGIFGSRTSDGSSR